MTEINKPENTKGKRRKLTRRDFLIFIGVTGGLYVGIKLGVLPYAQLKLAEFIDAAGSPPADIEAVPLAWFEIGTDNKVKIYIPKVEMGQGIHTTLAQIAAEELDVPWESISVLNVGTGKGLDDPIGTSASNSTSSLFPVIRQAGATVREMLRVEGAKQLGVSLTDAVAEAGSRAPRCRLLSHPCRRPCPHSAARTTRSRVVAGFSLRQLCPRLPAS